MNVWPHISLIVVNWNGRRFLDDCLSSMLATDYARFSVLVVDNASSDDSVEFVRRQFPQVEICRNDFNLGFAVAANIGLRRPGYDIAVILNPDVIVTRDWLRELVAPMLNDPTIGIAGCKLYYPGGRLIQHAGGYVTEPQALPGHYGLNEQESGQHNSIRDVDYVIGAALAVKRETLDQIGLFDEEYFLYFEDTDLCVRARRAGYRVVYVPGATAIHVESVVTNKGSLGYYRHMHTSRWRFLLKHYPCEQIVHHTVPAERDYVIRCNVEQRWALASAYLATLTRLPTICATRVRDGESQVNPDQVSQIGQELAGLRQAAMQTSSPPTERPLSDELHAAWQIKEQPFTSVAPIVGPLIARFREMWNSISTKWYVRPLIQQQNAINAQLVEKLLMAQETIATLDCEISDLRRSQAQVIYELRQELAQIRTPKSGV